MGKNIRGGRAEVEATIRDNVGRGLQKIKQKLNGFAVGAAKIGGGAIGAATAGLAPITAAVGIFLKAGDQMDKMSARTGESVEQLSTLGFIASETGSDVDQLERGIFGMQRTLRGAERGMKTSVDALGSLGLKLSDLQGLSPAEQLKLIADRLSGVEDAGRRGAIAQEIFGRAGRQLMPMLSMGAKGIEEMQQRARDLGLEMKGEDARSAALLTDRLFELWEIVKKTAFEVGAALAPTLINLVTVIGRVATGAIEFIQQHRQLVVIIAGGLAGVFAFGAGLLTMSALAVGASMAIGLVVGAIKILVAVVGLILSPIGLITAAVVAGAAAFLYYSGVGGAAVSWLQEKLGGLLKWGKAVFGGIFDAIKAGDWGLAGQIMWTALRIAFNKGIGWLMARWLDFKFGFINVFDLIVAGIRKSWNMLTTGLAKSFLWIVDKINAVSESIGGFRAIALDTEGIRAALDEDNRRFDQQLGQGLLNRVAEREQAKKESLEKFDTTELNDELTTLIKKAADQRAALDAEDKTPDVPPEAPEIEQFVEQQKKLPTGSAIGSFSASVLASISASEKLLEKRTAEASEQTAENTAEVVRLLQTVNPLTVT